MNFSHSKYPYFMAYSEVYQSSMLASGIDFSPIVTNEYTKTDLYGERYAGLYEVNSGITNVMKGPWFWVMIYGFLIVPVGFLISHFLYKKA